MADDEWKKREKALEDDYFRKENERAMARMRERKGEKRPSPITGEPMEQLTIMGVVVDQCPTSKGIWLDAGELEQILEQGRGDKSQSGFFDRFVSGLLNVKS